MLVGFETAKSCLFFCWNQLNIFGEICNSFFKFLSFHLKLSDFFLFERRLIFEFDRIIFFDVDVFFEITTGIFKMEQMMREIFVLIVLHVEFFRGSHILIDKSFDNASPEIS